MLSIVGHSLHTSIHKYVFIVHHETVINFGKEKAWQISLWIHIFLPAVLTVTWMVRPQYRSGITDYRFSEFVSINSCHGLQGLEELMEVNITIPFTTRVLPALTKPFYERFFFCGLGVYDGHTYFEYFIYVANQVYCLFQTVFTCLVVGNIIEIFFYKKIFNYMKR